MNSVCDVLITGGAGFIGAGLTKRFLANGLRVTCLDTAPFSRLEPHPALTLVTGDVRDAALVAAQVANAQRVVHLAAIVGVDEYMKDPAEVLDVNVLGTRCVLQACVEHNRPVLLTSSSEVYGVNTEVLREDSVRMYGSYQSPRWSYALSKSVGEQYAQAYQREGLTHVTIRFFNVYGPGLDRLGAGRVISKFLGHIRDGTPLPLVDGGEAVRSYCYVEEAIDATARLALSIDEGSSFKGKALNVGRAEPVSVRELADLLIHLSGHAAGTVDIPGETFFGANFEDIPRRVPDVSALSEAIGFEAKIDLTEGLRRTLAAVNLLASTPD